MYIENWHGSRRWIESRSHKVRK